jgi:hypothetical protein
MGKEGTFRPAAFDCAGCEDEVSILNRTGMGELEQRVKQLSELSKGKHYPMGKQILPYVAYMTDFFDRKRRVETIAHTCSSS